VHSGTRGFTKRCCFCLVPNFQWCAWVRGQKKINAPKSSLHNIIYDGNDSVVFQLISEGTATVDVDDDYVLTPLQAEAEDPEPDMIGDKDGSDDAADDTGMAADDYVQSLVTIESNWENGKWCVQIQISSQIFRRRYKTAGKSGKTITIIIKY